MIAGGFSFFSISAGATHSCGLTQGAATLIAYCWGGNAYGQLGNGTTENSLVPSKVVQ